MTPEQFKHYKNLVRDRFHATERKVHIKAVKTRYKWSWKLNKAVRL